MPNGNYYYGDLAIGSAGWAVGGDHPAADGTMVFRKDTYNGMILRPGEARFAPMLRVGMTVNEDQLVLPSMGFGGAFAVAVCYNDSDAQAVITPRHGVMISNDNGHSYKRAVNFGSIPGDPNWPGDSARLYLNRMAFDPANKNRLAISKAGVGLVYTLNAHAATPTVTTHPDIPQPLAQGGNAELRLMEPMFDRSSATTGGYTNRVVVASMGNGLYVSTTGLAGSFTHIAGSPDYFRRVVLHPDTGDIFVQPGNGEVLRYRAGAWSTIYSTGNGADTIVCRPGTSGNVIYLFGPGGGVSCCYNATASTPTFTNMQTPVQSRVAPLRPALAGMSEGYMSNGNTFWHPTRNSVVFGQGIGIWEWKTPPLSGTPATLTWEDIGIGDEGLVSKSVNAPWWPDPDNAGEVICPGDVFLTGDDRPFWAWRRDNVEKFPVRHGPAMTDNQTISHSNNADYAIDYPNHRLMCCGGFASWRMAYSDDKGDTQFTRMLNIPLPMKPTEQGGETLWSGETAVSNRGNAVVTPINHRRPYFNLDYTNPSSEWQPCDFGSPANAFLAENVSANGLHHAYYLSRIVTVADKYNPGHFYIYIIGSALGDARDLALRGIWKTTNGGANFTRIKNTLISGVKDFWNSKLKQVPGKPGHWWFTAGTVGNEGDEHDPYSTMCYSIDDMATWTQLGGSVPTEIISFGFGKNQPGALYPAIRCWSEDFGLYECLDFNPSSPNAATWTFLVKYPDGHFGFPADLTGDMGLFGRWYTARGGSGAGLAKFEKRGLIV